VSALDLTDPLVRAMADRNHQPKEMWTYGGHLRGVHCEECMNQWPCATREALTRLAEKENTR
jgi:hypothetical protein